MNVDAPMTSPECASKSNGKIQIVAVGGTIRPGSSTEKALRLALAVAAAVGAQVRLFSGDDIDLPMYVPERAEKDRTRLAT